MKNNLKGNKGITLVALIITIIVLLILAVVTISAVNEGSLFAHANNAATSYQKSQEDENTMISNYLTELTKHNEENTEKKSLRYFTLNSLETAGAKAWYDDGQICYDATKFWDVVGENLSGQYGLDADENGPTGIIGQMSTDSNDLPFVNLDFSNYSDGDFAIGFLESGSQPLVVIIYFYNDEGTLKYSTEYFQGIENGGYAEVLRRWGDVKVYFGVNE